MVTRTRTRPLSYMLLVLGTLVAIFADVGHDRLCAQPAPRWKPADDLSARAITLSAQEAATWVENGVRIILLKGNVFLEQGTVNARMAQAVVWVDEARWTKTRIYNVEVFADGNVSVQHGAQALGDGKPVGRALLSLSTRLKVDFQRYIRSLHNQAFPQDPLYQAALAERMRTAEPAAAPRPLAPAILAPGPALHTAQAAPAARLDPSFQRTAAQEEAPPPTPFRPAQAQPVPQVAPPAPAAPVPQAPGGTVPELPAPRPVEPEEEPEAPTVQFSIRARSSQPLKVEGIPILSTGETAVVVTSGVIININDPARDTLVDIEADRVVFWTRGDFERMLREQRGSSGQNRRQLEFYLSGNVEIRQVINKESRLIRADEVYYDVSRYVAIARHADLELKQPGLPDSVHLLTPELLQLNAKVFQCGQTMIDASKLPYDPELKLTTGKARLEQVEIPVRGFLGIGPPPTDPVTGQPLVQRDQLFRARNVVVWMAGVPVFYLPYVQGNAHDPLGPLENLMFNYNSIFGFVTYTTWDVYDLLGLTPTAGTRWRLNVDYLSARGPFLGTDYRFQGLRMFGVPARYSGLIRAYGGYDQGQDVLGGNRGQMVLVNPLMPQFVEITHPLYRGRLTGNMMVEDLPAGGFFRGQYSFISDRNFLEQYFNNEWNTDLNQETYLYGGQRLGTWMWTGLGEVNVRNWITETQWLPRADLFGLQKLTDWVTWTNWDSAGYANLKPTHQPPPPFPTDVTDKFIWTGRLDTTNELAAPFSVGAVRVVPYVVGDLTYYSNDLEKQPVTRVYGAYGARGSLPLSRLFPDVKSEFWNLNGIFHKIVFSANYYNAHSSVPYYKLPQLDRINDDTTDQAMRDIKVWQPIFYPGNGNALAFNPVFDPQTYAIRRLIMNRIDTRDTIEELQLDVRQRWQTKRGLPGAQHIVDWMTLDLNASFFPDPRRDNFGQSWSFLQYDWLWHVGDRVSLYSNAWYEPLSHGPRTYMFGVDTNRPDGLGLSLAYRQLDPLNSKNVLAIFSYPFSYKYRINLTSGYDFGNNIQFNSLMLTRVGTDLMVSIGFTYNSIINNYNFTFMIMPNLLGTKLVPGNLGTFNNGQGLITR